MRPRRASGIVPSILLVAVQSIAGLDDSAVAEVPEVKESSPQFSGKSIPDPPDQHKASTSPSTRVPPAQVADFALLFKQGLADPRGCELPGHSGDHGKAGQWATPAWSPAHGWVLPAMGVRPATVRDLLERARLPHRLRRRRVGLKADILDGIRHPDEDQ